MPLQPSAAPTPWWVEDNATGSAYTQVGYNMFDGCQQLCAAIGGGLVSIGSSDEYAFLLVSGLRGWIGLYNHRACTPKWTSGEDTDYVRPVVPLDGLQEAPANCHLLTCPTGRASCGWYVKQCRGYHSCVCERGLTTSERYSEWHDVQLHRNFALSVVFGAGMVVFGFAVLASSLLFASGNLGAIFGPIRRGDGALVAPGVIFTHFIIANQLCLAGAIPLMFYFGKPPKACVDSTGIMGTTFMTAGLVHLLLAIAWYKLIAWRLEAWWTARAQRKQEEQIRARDAQRCIELDAMPGQMTVFVALLDGSKVALRVDQSDTVETLKRRVHAKEGIDYRHQHLLLDQRELTDGTVESNAIAPNATIHLLMAAEAALPLDRATRGPETTGPAGLETAETAREHARA